MTGNIKDFITDWQKTAIFKSQMNAKRLHTSPASGSSKGFLPPDVNLKHKTPAFMLEKFITKYALQIAFVQAWVATLGSLYFSEIRHWKPCLLCWYQRILMYPLVIILAVALKRRDKNVAYYVLPITVFGMIIAFYHYMLQTTPLKEVTPIQCSSFGPCSEVRALAFGAITLPYFVTIPFLSLTAFTVISVMMVIMLKSKKKNVGRR